MQSADTQTIILLTLIEKGNTPNTADTKCLPYIIYRLCQFTGPKLNHKNKRILKMLYIPISRRHKRYDNIVTAAVEVNNVMRIS
jgi:hypothetical protein